MLELRGVRAGYGALNILQDVALTAAAGQLTAIIGANGAGKTTLLRAVAGLLPLGAGSIRLDGREVGGTPAWGMAQAGVTLVPEGRMLFGDMSVRDNLLMGAYGKAHRAAAEERLEAAYRLFPRLAERRRQAAGALSGGEAQMLALARGLMSAPRLLIVDEPSLGLAPRVTDELFATLARLRGEGRSIILVEQNTGRALDVADQVYLMQSGKIVLSQAAAEVDLDDVHARYFGAC